MKRERAASKSVEGLDIPLLGRLLHLIVPLWTGITFGLFMRVAGAERNDKESKKYFFHKANLFTEGNEYHFIKLQPIETFSH
jgi:hypothetical protein